MARDLYGRLKAYEDIAELCGGFDRLRELAEADKDGRVIILPCKVYETDGVRVYEHTVREVIYETAGGPAFDKNAIGKSIFLTRAEAERALRARRMADEYIRRDAAMKAVASQYGACRSPAQNRMIDEIRNKIRRMPAANVAEVCFPAELHVGDRAWKKAMSILDKKYAEAKKLPFIRDPLAWALYHTWREFDDGKRCD